MSAIVSCVLYVWWVAYCLLSLLSLLFLLLPLPLVAPVGNDDG